jgi:hypothetical protein
MSANRTCLSPSAAVTSLGLFFTEHITEENKVDAQFYSLSCDLVLECLVVVNHELDHAGCAL